MKHKDLIAISQIILEVETRRIYDSNLISIDQFVHVRCNEFGVMEAMPDIIKLVKKCIASIIFFLLFIPALAQNTLYIALQPCDMGIGLRYDRQVYSFGGYVSATQGAYRVNEVIRHRKVSGGILYKRFSLGLCYHNYGTYEFEYPVRTFKPVSFEIGAKNSTKRFTAGLRFDFIKREGTCDIGIKL